MKRFLELLIVLFLVFSIASCKNKDSKDTTLEDAKESLLLTGLDDVQNDLVLPISAKDGTVSITWDSSNTQVIANNGKVYRPEDSNVTVILTATITYDGETITKEFSCIVTKVTYTTYKTVASLFTGSNSGDEVAINGLIVTSILNNDNTIYGYTLYDGTTSIYVDSVYATISVGDVLDVIATYYIDNGQPLLKYTSKELKVTTVTDCDIYTLPVFTEYEIDALDNLYSITPVTGADNMDKINYAMPISFHGYVTEEDGCIYVVEYDENDSSDEDDFTSIKIDEKSNYETVRNHIGKYVSINAFLFKYNTEENIQVIIYDDNSCSVSDNIVTDIQKQELNELDLDYQLPETIDDDILLPIKTAYGQDITWEVTSNGTITDGFLLAPMDTSIKVELTGTYSFDDGSAQVFPNVEYIVDIKIITEPFLLHSIVEVIAFDDGKYVKVEGIITGEDQTGYFVKDKEEVQAIYMDIGPSFVNLADYNLFVGDEIVVIGSTQSYMSVEQMSVESVQVVTQDNTIRKVVLTSPLLDSAETEYTFANQYIIVIDLKVISLDDGEGYILLDDDNNSSTYGFKILASDYSFDDNWEVGLTTVTINGCLERVISGNAKIEYASISS